MGWNPRWQVGKDNIRLCSLLDFLTDIANAINERASVTPTASMALPIRLGGLLDYMNVIQNRVTQLIIEFVNHTDSGGDWQNKVGIPNWTHSSIMAALGQTRLVPTELESSLDWIYQQYDIIELLRWRVETLILADRVDSDYKDILNNVSWAAAVAEFNAQSWGNKESGFVLVSEYPGHGAKYINVSTGYLIYRRRGSNFYTNSSGFDIDTDCYGTFDINTDLASDYENNDYAVDFQKLGKIESPSINNGDSHTVWVADINNNSVTDPLGATDDTKTWALDQDSLLLVKKYDFDFKDY